MVYPYIVIKDGIWYPSGANVPDGFSSVKAEEPKKKLTKTEIARLKADELKAIAKDYGIDDSQSGSAIRKCLIDKLGL